MVRWCFLDMNSFFAGCEQHDDKRLRGRPVGVCPILAESGAVIAASYEAKAAGVGMGCRAAEARRICPGIVLLQARPKRYVELHHAIFRAMEHIIPVTKAYSIDEWSIRLRGKEREPEVAIEIGRRLKQRIADDLSPALRCSVGIAPTRMLAKTACELDKPDGLACLVMSELPGRLNHLELTDLPGIGGGIGQRLARADIRTIEQLWALSESECRRLWGSVQGAYFWRALHGIDTPEVPTKKSSVGHSHVLPPDKRIAEPTKAIMIRLLCKAAMRLRHIDHLANGLHLWINFTNGVGWGRDIALPAVQDTATILQHFERLWQQRPTELFPATPRRDAGPKNVGVDLVGLTPRVGSTAHLFAGADRPQRLSHVLDAINARYGSHTVHPAAMHSVVKYAMDDKIAFGRVPDEQVAM
jgi:DNA polymerase-4